MSIQYGQPLMLAAFMQRRCRSSPLISPDALPPETEVRNTSIVSRPGVTLMTAAARRPEAHQAAP